MRRGADTVFLAPSGRGLSAKPTGGEKMRITSLPPSRPKAVTPPSQREARGCGFPRQSADWLGMTIQERHGRTVGGRRGGRLCPPVSPSVTAKGRDTSLTEGGKAAPSGAAGRCTPRVLVPLRSTSWASPPTDGLSVDGALFVIYELFIHSYAFCLKCPV